MNIIGFNFTKMAATKMDGARPTNISTNIEFTDLAKDKVELLKDADTSIVSFKYSLNYEGKKDATDKKEPNKQGEILLEGKITLTVTKDESKNLSKSWKKKQLPEAIKVPLFNLILKKCTPKTVFFQDEVNLPSHIPMPRISQKQQQN